MAWCLTKPQAEKFKQALKDGSINPFKLAQMTSEQRNNLFTKTVSEENASKINALFESKLLLKNQQQGFITWAKRVSGITPQVKRDMLSKIERLDDVLEPVEQDLFLRDLASQRLGLDITAKEAENISKLSKNQVEARNKWQAKINTNKRWNSDPIGTKSEWMNDPDRIKYGASKVEIEKYVNDLKIASKKIPFTEQPFRASISAVKGLPGVLKSLMSSLDNSLWGRQGIKTLLDLRTSSIWTKNFVKSWSDIGRQLIAKGGVWTAGDDAVMDSIKVDIFSRPNAINGKYKAGGYGLEVLSEEAFPSSFQEKIPILGRLFKASEVAYNGGALRLRADMADRYIALAEKHQVNTLNPDEARGIGHLVGSMTGRGSLGKAETIGKELNVLLYSVKFLKSNIDTLTAHQFDPKATKFTKTEARKNLVSMTATLAATLALAKMIDPDIVDEDPRSTNFGKIKLFGRWTDITGGMGALITLSARLTPTQRNGEWGLWKKSSTGTWTNLIAGKFGQQDAVDVVIEGLFLNKLSPIASVLRDAWRGEHFGGEPFNITTAITNSTIPLSIQTFNDVKDGEFASVLSTMISEGVGFSVGTYKYRSYWEKSTSKEMIQFKQKVGEEKFLRANDDYNRAYNVWFDEVRETEEYKRLSQEARSDLTTKARRAIKEKIFKEYNFKYKREGETQQDREEERKIKQLVPRSLNNTIKDFLSRAKEIVVPAAYAAGVMGNISEEYRDRDLRTARDWYQKYPEWYRERISTKDEIIMFGEQVTEYLTGEASHYNPRDPAQTRPDNPEGIGAYGRKVSHGSVAFGNRMFHDRLKAGEIIYIQIKGFEDIETPYGKGTFRIDDTMNKRYDVDGKDGGLGIYNIDFYTDDLNEERLRKGRFAIEFKIVGL